MTNDRDTFPTAVEAIVLIGALYTAEYVVAAALYDMRGFLGMEYGDLWSLIMVLGNGCVFTVLMHYKGLSYRDLFHSSSSSVGATVLVLVPAIALTVPALLLIMEFIQQFLVWMFPLSSSEQATFTQMASGSFSSLVAVCILAPVLEEMLFRGIILRSFLRQYARWEAIVGSAALFGFAHLNLYQYVGGVIIGVFLGWLYERTRSLLPCIALHATYNSGCMLVARGAADHDGGGMSAWWIAALILGSAGSFVLQRVLLTPQSPRKMR